MSTATLEAPRANAEKYAVTYIPMSEVFADSNFNCRGEIPVHEILDIARDVKQRGLDQPIVLQPYSIAGRPNIKWRVVAGHRRHRAYQYNQMQKVPNSDTIPAFIRYDLDEAGARSLNLRENLHRKNLNILQEANALKYFLDQKNGITGRYLWSDDELGQMFGQSRGWVQHRRDLLRLPREIQLAAASGILTIEHIKKLAKMTSDADRFELVKKIKDAQARGEKIDLTPSITRAEDIHARRDRRPVEIEEMGGIVYDLLGPNIVTRFSAWSRGLITTVDFMNDVRKECQERGVEYKQPDFLRRAMTGAA